MLASKNQTTKIVGENENLWKTFTLICIKQISNVVEGQKNFD